MPNAELSIVAWASGRARPKTLVPLRRTHRGSVHTAIAQLLRAGPKTCPELMAGTGKKSKGTVNSALADMRDSGMVVVVGKRGRFAVYGLAEGRK